MPKTGAFANARFTVSEAGGFANARFTVNEAGGFANARFDCNVITSAKRGGMKKRNDRGEDVSR